MWRRDSISLPQRTWQVQVRGHSHESRLHVLQQEDLYTTKLDKGKSRISEAEAERLAKEIMREAQSGGGGAVNNAHIAEERGMEIDDSGVRQDIAEQLLSPQINSKGHGLLHYVHGMVHPKGSGVLPVTF